MYPFNSFHNKKKSVTNCRSWEEAPPLLLDRTPTTKTTNLKYMPNNLIQIVIKHQKILI